jgi:hypothetical protein
MTITVASGWVESAIAIQTLRSNAFGHQERSINYMSQEPELVDPEDPFGDSWKPGVRPKWAAPTNETEELILSAVDQRFFLTTSERDMVHKISVNMHSLTERESEFPTEWVRRCCTWAKKKRDKGEFVKLRGLISLIYNKERRDLFVEEWIANHRDELSSPRR